MKIAFLVGSISLNGGNYVILQHALFATKHGHSVTIFSMSPCANENPWHPALSQLKIVELDKISSEHYDIAIATYFSSIFLLDWINADTYAYFVQSIESRFFDKTQDRIKDLVEKTYGLGLQGITEATWIKEYLYNKYNMQYHLVLNGIRKDLYTSDGYAYEKRGIGKMRVLVEGPFGSPIKNTGRTINLCNKVRGLDVWLLTSTNISWYPWVNRLYSKVAIESVPPIYRSCDVLVKLSLVEGMFGPPLEMFHCGGTVIVYNVTGFDEYIKHGENALVAELGNEDTILEYLKMLRDDPRLLERLKIGALSTATRWHDWNESSANFLDSLQAILNEKHMKREELSDKVNVLRAEFPNETDRFMGRFANNSRPDNSSKLRKKIRETREILRYMKEGI
jgi:glycosyltransferase involved in cell wall biosynthesis